MTVAVTSTVSSVLLPTLAILVALLVGLAGVWVAYAVGYPSQRLIYGLPVVTPLLMGPHGAFSGLELKHQQTVLSDPYVLELELVSRGRKDIPSSVFDNGEPIKFDVGAHIATVLQVTSEPDFYTPPKLTVDGTVLEIGPSLIYKKQRITVTILADGKDPQLKAHGSLQNVRVQHQGPLKPGWLVPITSVAIALTLPAVIYGILWVLLESGIATPKATDAQTASTQALAIAAFPLIIAAICAWIYSWIQFQRRRQ